VLAAFASAIAAVILPASYRPLSRLLSAENLRDLGNLLLAFVLLWAYLSFSQFLLIWMGNLPEEVPWYLRRLEDGWQAVGLVLVVFHFALPVVLLRSRDVKRNIRTLAVVAGLALFMRLVDPF
jgi:hypothetical protein